MRRNRSLLLEDEPQGELEAHLDVNVQVERELQRAGPLVEGSVEVLVRA
jgi:hypothetical protein